jgi:radical SAM superfamily enzyme YgiQ (UPF0313 family)
VKIDLYLLDKHVKIVNLVSYPMMDILTVWTRSLGHEIRVATTDERGVNLDTDADVVAIRSYTQMAPAAYRLGEALMKKGKIVIFGGPHFHCARTIEEAKPFCNVVVETICFEQWRDLLASIAGGMIVPGRTETLHVVDRENRFVFPDNLWEAYRDMKWPRIPLIMATLGCPYRCDYCNPFMQGKYISRDIDTVYREMSSTNNRLVGFCDATFGLNKQYTRDLMMRIAPLKKYLFVETTLSLLHDRDMLDSLTLGGTKWLAVGMESLSTPQQKHGRNRVTGKDISAVIDLIRSITDRGILVQANFICGMDGDTVESFDRIYEFYVKSKVGILYIDILAPHPTSALFGRLEGEGRITDYNWEHYDYHHIVYRPKDMTVEQLVDGYSTLYHSLTTPSMLARKAIECVGISGPKGMAMAAWNIANHFDAKTKEKSNRRSIMEN